MITSIRLGADYLHHGAGAMLDDFATWLRPDSIPTALKRWSGLIVVGAFVLYLLIMTPVLMWPLTAATTLTAGRRGYLLARQRLTAEQLLHYLAEGIGPRNGVLLADVLGALHDDDLVPAWTVTDLRRACEEQLLVRVRRTLNVDGRRSVGVHRDDLASVLRAARSPEARPGPVAGSSAGQSATTRRTPIGGGGVAWSVHGPAVNEAGPLPKIPPRDDFEDHTDEALALLDDPEEVTEP